MSGTESARVKHDAKLTMAREVVAGVWKARNENAALGLLRLGRCDHYREVQSALAAIEATTEAAGWRPIETAPKNEAGEFLGPDILIYYTANGLPWPAYWGPSADSRVDGAWISHDDDCREFSTEHVTHWMPLPAAPNLETRHD